MAEYGKLTPELAEELKKIVGAEQVLMGEDIKRWCLSRARRKSARS